MKTSLVAFCGIDGSGKTSLLRGLAEQFAAEDVISIANSYELTFLIERYLNRTYNDGRDWLGGTFAHSIALVGCFEFVAHYDTNIRPWIGKRPLVLCDRYELCYRAYLRTVGVEFNPDDLFANICKPDVVVFADVSSSLLPERYAARGGPKESETMEMAERFRKSYRSLLRHCESPIVEVDTSKSFDESLAALQAGLAEHLPGAFS